MASTMGPTASPILAPESSSASSLLSPASACLHAAGLPTESSSASSLLSPASACLHATGTSALAKPPPIASQNSLSSTRPSGSRSWRRPSRSRSRGRPAEPRPPFVDGGGAGPGGSPEGPPRGAERSRNVSEPPARAKITLRPRTKLRRSPVRLRSVASSRLPTSSGARFSSSSRGGPPATGGGAIQEDTPGADRKR